MKIRLRLIALLVAASMCSHAQTLTVPQSRVVANIDETQLTPLAGNTALLPAGATDLGAVSSATAIHRIQIVLRRSAKQDMALTQFIDRQQDAHSPYFHQWLTPAEFGAQFGPSDNDLSVLTAWLAGHGFSAIKTNAGRTVVEFTGPASAVEGAFHTAMHIVSVEGQVHYANVTDPAIPAALAPIIGGIASLNSLPRLGFNQTLGNFRRDSKTGTVTSLASAANSRSVTASAVHPDFTVSSNATTYYAITPYDFATIYDVLPLWTAATPIDGTGQTIAVVGDTDINPADFVSFRKLFNLPLGNTSTATGTQYLNIIYNGPDPGVKSDEGQGDIDTQWAAGVAKGATIDYVVSESTEASSGTDLSAAYIVDNNLAGILTYSYSQCELALGTGGNAFYNALWQQAAAQGIAVVSAAGDSGAAACDTALGAPAVKGLAVNGHASTPYNTAVGGTEFYAPGGIASYFNTTNNATTQASAKSYIPEETWNDSCANPSFGLASPYLGLTQEQVCNNTTAQSAGLARVVGSGGGASKCTVSDGKTVASCSGGYAKPAWQTGTGVPADSARDVPDVSLFASQGRNGSFYVVCQQDLDTDGKSCNTATPYADFEAYGGTGVTAPAFAGILALVAQKTGTRLGNANYVLYDLAAKQSPASCNATGSPSAACIFHDITTGSNAQPCVTASPNCTTTTAGDAYGVLTGNNAGVGYDLATGLGSVDAANLVNGWSSATFSATTAVLTLTPQSIVHGAGVAANVSVTAASGTPTGSVSINAQAGNGALGAGTLSAGTYATTLHTLPGGSYGVQAHYGGDATYAATDSNFVSVTVTPENSTTKLTPIAYNGITGVSTTGVTSAPYGTVFYVRADVAGLSGQGVATGNVLIDDNGSTINSGTFRLNSSGYTEAQVNSLVPGGHTFSAQYTGDASFNPGTANNASITITPAPTSLALATSATTVSQSATITLTATVATQSLGYYAPSGVATFFSGSTVLGTSKLLSGTNSATFYDQATAALTITASLLPLGPDSITVTYAGDTNYQASSSTAVVVTVTPPTSPASSTKASATPSVVQPAGTITFAATVAPTTATGTIQFLVDAHNIGSPITLSSGSASLTETVDALATLLLDTGTTLTAGSHVLTAVYSGSSSLSSSVSPAVAFVIATPTTASLPVITLSPSTAVQGTYVQVQTKITPTAPVPTGTVQVILDGGPYGSALALVAGVINLPLVTTTLQAGAHVVSVSYSGDSTYEPTYAANATLTITAHGSTPSAINLTGVPVQVAPGSPLPFNAVITPTSPVPTGIVQLIVDGGYPQTPIAISGTSTSLALPTTGLALGAHTISAFYPGDATYSFSTAPVVNFNILNPYTPGSFTLTPTNVSATAYRLNYDMPSVTLTITPTTVGNFPVTFACLGLPAHTDCNFAPSTISVSGLGASFTTLTFTLNDNNTADNRLGRPGWLPLSGGVVAAGAIFLLLPKRRRRFGPLLTWLLIAAAITTLSGCGSGYASFDTPAGTFNVTIVAAGGGGSQAAALTLTIK